MDLKAAKLRHHCLRGPDRTPLHGSSPVKGKEATSWRYMVVVLLVLVFVAAQSLAGGPPAAWGGSLFGGDRSGDRAAFNGGGGTGDLQGIPGDTYTPLLPPRALQRGLLQRGELARMRIFVDKLIRGESVTVVALGGSVTWGAMQGDGYVSQFFRWLNQTFPPRPGAPPHQLLNRGVGGSTSALFSICTQHFVPPAADLVLLEFALNDKATVNCGALGKDSFNSGSRRTFEVLLRRLLTWRSRPALALLMYYSWFMSKHPDKACLRESNFKVCSLASKSQGLFHVSGENDLAVLGSYYALPILSMRAAIYPMLLAGGKGFNVSTWASPANKQEQRGVLPNLDDLVYYDPMHPADQTGMRYLTELLITLVRHTAADLAQHPLSREDREVAGEALLPPMVPGNEAPEDSSCYLQRDMEGLASLAEGFEFVNEQTKKTSEKWGWVGREPGARVVFELDIRLPERGGGATSGGAPATDDADASEGSGGKGGNSTSAAGAQPRAKVYLGYLKSYEHMGRAEVRCTAHCSCTPVDIEGHWDRPVSLPDVTVVVVHLPDRQQAQQRCQLSVTIAQGTSSGEHKVKIVSLMVLDWDINSNVIGGGHLSALGNQEEFGKAQWAFKKATNQPAAGKTEGGGA